MTECKGRVIPARAQAPTLGQIVRAMTLFAENPFDAYDGHMFKTGHYPQMNACLSAACTNGHLQPPKIVDLGCGTGVQLSHVIASLLNNQITNPGSSPPLQVYGIDATEAMLRICQARILRRLGKLIATSKPEEGHLVAYGVDSAGKKFRFKEQDLTKEKQSDFISEAMLIRESETMIGGEHVILPKKLLHIKFILQDVLGLNAELIPELSGASTILSSYCFHWFINKPAVAKLISDLLDPSFGKFISIEEWPLHVTLATYTNDEEKRFHEELVEAIKSATTPIEVVTDLYRLFAENGLVNVPFTNGGKSVMHLQNTIDGYHDMLVSVFMRSVPGSVPSTSY